MTLHLFMSGEEGYLRDFHLAFSNMIALILQTKNAKRGFGQLPNRSFQLYIGRLSNWPLSGSVDAENLCKLDIGQDYIYYLAPIGPTLTWGPWWFRSCPMSNHALCPTTLKGLGIPFSLMHSYLVIIVYTCQDIAVFCLLWTEPSLLSAFWVWKLACSGSEIGQGIVTFYWGSWPQLWSCPSLTSASISSVVGWLPIYFVSRDTVVGIILIILWFWPSWLQSGQ